MPVKDVQPLDCICSGIGYDTEINQTLFLGCSVQSFGASVGWNSSQSSLDVVLREDDCEGDRVCYDTTCFDEQNITTSDPGFFGDPRWQRAADYVVDGKVRFPAGSHYSSCTKEFPADTLVRAAINLEGLPAYFRMGNFEWCGVISDWVKDIDCDSHIQYRVKLVDPRVILEKTNLIIGEYPGAVNCTGACANTNFINVYGFMEFLNGVPCTAYAQEAFDCLPPNSSEWGSYDSVANLGANVSVDGLVFGTPSNGFGGSHWTEDGMPWARIYYGFNYLVNSIPGVVGTNYEQFSPYGRIVFCKASYFTDWDAGPCDLEDANLAYGFPPNAPSEGYCGLMDQDNVVGACTTTLNYYFVDLSELTQVFDLDAFCSTSFSSPLDSVYRLSGTSVTLMEMIEQMSSDFGFDYYIDLVPARLPDAENCTSIAKFIKLRIVNKKVAGAANNAICCLTDTPQCQESVSQGRELRTDSTSRFLLGAPKQTIFQAKQDVNPDALFCGGNDAGTLAGYSFNPAGSAAVAACRTINYNGTGYEEMDNMILPYMGKDENDDLVLTGNVGGDCGWYWELPTMGLASSLHKISFAGRTVKVTESELRAALISYDTWHTVTLHPLHGLTTEIGNLVRALGGRLGVSKALFVAPRLRSPAAPKDAKAPGIRKFTSLDEAFQNDMSAIYQWIQKYAQEYYASQWAVRVPFTCCYPDFENQRSRISERPTNDGGWTEVCEVLGLPNSLYSIGDNFEMLNFFRTKDRKILPFLCFQNAVLIDTSRLPKDAFFFRWIATDDILSNAITGNGPPTGSSTAGQVYIDNLTGMIHLADAPIWIPINNAPIYVDTVDPAVGVTPTRTLPASIFLWVNRQTYEVFFVYSWAVDVDNELTSINFEAKMAVNLYVKATVETDYAFHDSSHCYVPRAIIKTPGPVYNRDDSFLLGAGYLYLEGMDQLINKVGGEDASLATQPCGKMPDAAAIPIKHNSINYGPWCNPGNPSWGGELVQDDGFAPWSFGSYASMNEAGLFYSCAGRKDGKGAEIGNITVPGYPVLPLGAELGALTGLGAGYLQYLIETRSLTDENASTEYDPDGTSFTYSWKFIDYGTFWTGQFGPNLTSIQVEFGNGCDVKTTYSFRSYAPRETGFNRKLIERLQKANTINNRLLKKVDKLEEIVERLRAITGL